MKSSFTDLALICLQFGKQEKGALSPFFFARIFLFAKKNLFRLCVIYTADWLRARK